MSNLQCFAQGKWYESPHSGVELLDAATGAHVANCSSEGLDYAGMLSYGRRVGGPALRRLTFHQRADLLKRLAQHLSAHKEILYTKSWPTGATRADAWIDIEGGIATLFTFASKARRELPNETFAIEGDLERISRNGTFVGRHVCVPLEGCAVHINAFNFPCWGLLEKLAPTLLAGVPAIIKPASSTAYLAEALVKLIVESKILPEGALQLICGGVGNLLDHLTCQDVVTCTGSRSTGKILREHPTIIAQSVRLNLEADSLNCSVLGAAANPQTREFSLFVDEVVKEVTVKTGQKCTAIRRVIVPRGVEEAVVEALKKRFEGVIVGDPRDSKTQMGPLANVKQAGDVRASVAGLLANAEQVWGETNGSLKGAFMTPILLRAADPLKALAVHNIEAFGPVTTVMAYADSAEAIELARMGEGSLVSSVFTPDDDEARKLCLGLAPFHGRILLGNATCSGESTGHGSPLPHLVHGGPGRAGGGEELGGVRSVFHYMQRTALQGSPQTLTRVTGIWQSGAAHIQKPVHPFRKYFDELEIGETLVTKARTITDADVGDFAKLSGDYFYAHVNDEAAAASVFGKRVAHGYFVLAAAAGLFVDPEPGPVIANYGLERLRFIKPVYIGDTIRVRLTCKQKTPKAALDPVDPPQGVVYWDVEVKNQLDETVAIYTVLTLVKRANEEDGEKEN